MMVNLAIHHKPTLVVDDYFYIFYMTKSYMFLSVRGMMYYRKALELQCALEFPNHNGLWHS